MLNKLKNWWPQILLILGAAADLLADLLPAVLEYFELDPGTANYIRFVMYFLSIYASKKAPSSVKPDKLYEQAANAQIKSGLE